MTFLYNNVNWITTMQQGGTRTTYVYDENGNPFLENIAGTFVTTFYDPENRITSVRSALGPRSTYTNDGDGMRRSAQEPGGVRTTGWGYRFGRHRVVSVLVSGVHLFVREGQRHMSFFLRPDGLHNFPYGNLSQPIVAHRVRHSVRVYNDEQLGTRPFSVCFIRLFCYTPKQSFKMQS